MNVVNVVNVNTNVFVYGTLMAEEVVHTLLGRVPRLAPAVLPNFRRHAIVGRRYPAIVPAQGHEVKGKVLFDLTVKEVIILDKFEDEEYRREDVTVYPPPGLVNGSTEGLPCTAAVYVWANHNDPNLQGEWDYQAWRNEHLKSYQEMSQEFVDDGAQWSS